MVFVVQDAAINQTSDGSVNPMDLAPQGLSVWQNVALKVGGARTYPVQPLSMATNDSYITGINGNSLDLGVLYQLYRACANDKPFLRDIDFTNIQPLCFPISATKEAWDPSEEVSLSFQGRLSGVPPSNYSIVMVSFTDSIIEMTKEGQVLVT